MERLSLWIFPLLTCLVRSLLIRARPIKARPIRRIKTTNEVPNAAENKDKFVTLTPLLWVSILFLKKKERILPKSSAISAIKKSITLISILGIRKKS